MGLIWNKMRHGRIPERALVLQEVEGTVSRRWPFLWRFYRYWYLLQVGAEAIRQPYYLYRSEGKHISRFYLLVHTPQVMVPVGKEKVYYWAETRTHQPLFLTLTGIKKAGFFIFKRTKGLEKNLQKLNYTKT
jgi:hypothetical protein